MGILFSRGRHDFLTYEKSLERITQESSKLLVRRSKRKASFGKYRHQLLTACYFSLIPCIAWVAYLRQQPHGYYTTAAYFFRTAAPFIFPVAMYLLSTTIQQLVLFVERREDKQLKKITDAKKKLIKELKDSTSFEKTMALLKKYDPEVMAPPPRSTPPPGAKGRSGPALTPASSKIASSILTSALDSVGTFATKFIGDNPTLLEELRKAQAAAMSLKQENDVMRQQLEQLCSKYNEVPAIPLLAMQPDGTAPANSASEQSAASTCTVSYQPAADRKSSATAAPAGDKQSDSGRTSASGTVVAGKEGGGGKGAAAAAAEERDQEAEGVRQRKKGGSTAAAKENVQPSEDITEAKGAKKQAVR